MRTTDHDQESHEPVWLQATRLELLAGEAGLAPEELRAHLRQAINLGMRARAEAHGRGRPRGTPRKT
jgi:hypothetical protein